MKKLFAWGAALVAVTVMLGGCAAGSGPSPSGADEGTPVPGGTLTWGIPAEPDAGGLDPMVATTVAAETINAVAYDTLLAQDDDGKVIPALATSWKQPDDLTWVFELRKGVTFADGTPFTADDVVYSFQERMKPGAANATYLSSVDSVEKTGDLEVTFHFSQPDGTFLDAVSARQTFYIVSKDGYGKATDEQRQTQTFGTGPFQLKDWKQGVSLTFEKNTNYWGESGPYIDTVVFELYPDESTMLAAVQQGSVQAASFLDGTLASQAEQAGYTLGDAAYRQNLAIYINPESGPLSDLRVRRAFSLALDRKALVDTAMMGMAGISFVPPAGDRGAPDANGLPYYTHDVAEAKKLLAEAGQPNPQITLRYMGDVAQAHHPVYEMMQQQLAEAGITLKLEATPLAEIAPVFTSGESWTDLVAIPGSPRASAVFYLEPVLLPGGVYNHWDGNPDAEHARDLLKEAKKTADPDAYAKLVDELAQEAADKVLEFVPAAVPVYYEVWDSNRLHGYKSDTYYSRFHLAQSWLTE
ncbi:ABC transporter substrate-binding protein [Microbacterium horticulturae]|uniref:ABC transporter substrate-binding protein n=1 Tax=Microbacterium horticulturae TaxID=3028316 RepID=A0ABY8BWY2_9MICO|nr:ABC transporter substrate-binding protein [Microbacterium sp. KACC 23027]WEG08676.1 ABC transporter substrate-binding protein [Microbacterium sp. KACC 23027]